MGHMSNKREAFCRYIAIDGLTASDSYRKAFNSNPINQSSIHEQASKLMSNDKVSTRIEALKADISDKLVWNKAEIMNQLAINVEASREANQFAASNRSLELLGKAVGNVFEPDTVAVSGTVSVIHSLSDAQLDQLVALASEPVAIDDSEAIEAEYKMLDSEAS
tara:strand:+ start:168 stop:659 length:492 start_codon:yes stop_codon:yes gene_type:complete